MPGVELFHVELLLLSVFHHLRFLVILPDGEGEVDGHLALPPASFHARPVDPVPRANAFPSLPIQLVELQISVDLANVLLIFLARLLEILSADENSFAQSISRGDVVLVMRSDGGGMLAVLGRLLGEKAVFSFVEGLLVFFQPLAVAADELERGHAALLCSLVPVHQEGHLSLLLDRVQISLPHLVTSLVFDNKRKGFLLAFELELHGS